MGDVAPHVLLKECGGHVDVSRSRGIELMLVAL
jgi:hypothetical protein